MFADFIDAVDTEAREVRFRIHDGGYTPGAAQGPAVPEPFDVTFAGADCTFTMCAYERQGITRFIDDLTHTVTGDDGFYWLSMKAPMVTGTVTIHQSATRPGAVEVTLDESATDYYKLLYKIEKATDGGTVSLRVVEDWRKIPQMVLAI